MLHVLQFSAVFVPPSHPPPPIYRHQCCLFLLSSVIASVCQIYFSSFFPSFFPLLFSLKSLTGCTKLIDIKAAGHLPFWFLFYFKKGKQCPHQILALIWPSTTNIQFDILHIVLMHFYIIYLAWFFRKGDSRGMTAAEDVCLICFKPHVRAENQHLQSGWCGQKSVGWSNLYKVIMCALRHPFLDFLTPPCSGPPHWYNCCNLIFR